MLRLSLLLVLVACATPSRERPDAPPAAVAPNLADAARWERGDARDYRRSAALYEQLCADGAGDAIACHRWLDALLEARGVGRDRGRALALAQRLCRQNDRYACLLETFYGEQSRQIESDPEVARVRALFEDLKPDCLAGDLVACEVWLIFDAFPGGDGPGDSDPVPLRACRLGSLTGCWVAFMRWPRDCYLGDDGDESISCLAATIAKIEQKYPDAAALAAYRRVDQACQAGDVKACRFIPGRAIAPGILCDAHDYGACADASCAGRATTRAARRKTSRDHGVEPHCRELTVAEPLADGCRQVGEIFSNILYRSLRSVEVGDEIRSVCEEQDWPPAYRACMSGNTDPCHTQRRALALDVGEMWRRVLAAERAASCSALGPATQKEVVRVREWLYLRFADLLVPELSAADRQTILASADRALAELPTCP